MNIETYKVVESLEEAYTLNQNRNNVVYGGGCFLRLGNRDISTVIDLSQLELDEIKEEKEAFFFGSMVSLRQLETHKGLNEWYDHIFEKSTAGIVGVPFRNCATVGGTLAQKVNFSDIIPILMVLGAAIQLFPSGQVPIAEYMENNYPNEIVVGVHLKKQACIVSYAAFRKTATDLPALVCAVAKDKDNYKISVGARPGKAIYLESPSLLDTEIDHLVEKISFGSNGFASQTYREHLANVYIKRLRTEVLSHENNL